jgi:peptide/nickel transport system substrate-binding protein
MKFPRLISLLTAGLLLPASFVVADPPGTIADPDGNNPDGKAADGFGSYPVSDFVEQGKGQPGGTLKVSVAVDLNTLDFHIAAGGHWIGRILYDNLVYLDNHGNITPWLAKSWEVSPDGKTYTFHLRDDVTFSDGTKFDAEAVRVNLAHIVDPASKSAAAASYIQPYVDGKVIDAHTFEAHLREPYSAFLSILANSFFGMISPKQIKEDPKGLDVAPVTTGPFLVESHHRQQDITFVKRKDYNWSPPYIQHQGPAYLDRIEVKFVPEAIVRYSTLASGQFDFTLDAPLQDAPAIRADPSLVMIDRDMPGNTVRGPIFNDDKPPFDDVRIRKAFALALDREGIAQLVGFGELKPRSDFLSPNMIGYDPSFQGILKYDVAEANRILDGAGWQQRDADGYRVKNGQRLSATVTLSQGGSSTLPLTDTTAMVEIQSEVKKIGFELKISQVPTGQLMVLRSNGDYQALGLVGAYAGNNPASLYLYYHGSQIPNDHYIGQNVSRLHDAQLDDLMVRALHSTDPAQFKDLYHQIQARLIDLVPSVPLYEYQVPAAYKSYVKGILYDTSCNRPSFTTAWLDPNHS